MRKYSILLLIPFILFACSKSDNPSENPKDEVGSPIGLKYYGEVTNSSDTGVDIFTHEGGYVSFENHNLTDNINREGDSDIVFRKLDDSLKTINQVVFDTNTFDILFNAVPIANNKFALAGRRQVNTPLNEFNAVPFIQIVDDSGNPINSVILEVANNVSIGSLIQVFHKNDILYVAVRSGLNLFTIYALDMELNTIWNKSISTESDASDGRIFVDDVLYFATETEKELNNSKNVISLYSLELTSGDLIDTFVYDELYDDYGIANLMVEGNDLYIFGGARLTSGLDGFILKVNKVDGQKKEYLFVRDMYSVTDVKIQDSDILLAGSARPLTVKAIQKLNSSNEEVWSYTAPNIKIRNLLLKNDGSLLFTGSGKNSNSSDGSTDVVIGLLNGNGILQ